MGLVRSFRGHAKLHDGERLLREEIPLYSPCLVSGSSKRAKGKCPSGQHRTEGRGNGQAWR